MLLLPSASHQFPRRLFVSGCVGVLSVLWGAWGAILCSNTSMKPLAELSLLVTGLMLFVLWVACQIALGIWPVPAERRGFRWLSSVPPIVFVLTVALALTDIDLSGRLWLSHGPLEEVARSTLSGNGDRSLPRWIGCFPVSRIERIEESVRFTTAERFLGSSGLTYSPGQPPPRVDKDEQRHLWGPWWVWRN